MIRNRAIMDGRILSKLIIWKNIHVSLFFIIRIQQQHHIGDQYVIFRNINQRSYEFHQL